KMLCYVCVFCFVLLGVGEFRLRAVPPLWVSGCRTQESRQLTQRVWGSRNKCRSPEGGAAGASQPDDRKVQHQHGDFPKHGNRRHGANEQLKDGELQRLTASGVTPSHVLKKRGSPDKSLHY
uniref:Uncharacterized protein n=1 Tax=Oryzias latipes TaxID=8090 RepID=A0A3B3HLE5_ORYLA